MAIIPLSELPGAPTETGEQSQTQSSIVPLDQLPGGQNYTQGTSSPESGEDMFPGDIQSQANRSFTPSPMTPMQRSMLAFVHRPEAKATLAENLGFETGGFDDKGNLLVKNKQTGEFNPVRPTAKGFTNFLKDITGRVAEFAPEAITLGSMVAGEAAGTATMGPGVGTIAGGVGGAAVGSAINKGIESSLTGQNEMNAGDMASNAIGAAAGYATFGALKWAAKGAGRLVYGNMAKLGPVADELTEMVAGTPRTYGEILRARVKVGQDPNTIINEANKTEEFLSSIPRGSFFGSPKADITLPNFVNTAKRNLWQSSNEASTREMYKETFGMSDEMLDAVKKRSTGDLLDPKKVGERALLDLGHQIKEDIQTGYKFLQSEYQKVQADMARLGKDKVEVNIAHHLNGLIESLKQNRILSADTRGNIFFNPEYSNKTALSEYKHLLSRFKVTANIGGDTTVMPSLLKSKDVNTATTGELMGRMKEMQTALNRMIDPASTIPAVDKRPMAEFVGKIRNAINENVDYQPYKEMNVKYKKFMDGKELFEKASESGVQGELGMLKVMDRLTSSPSATDATAQAESLAIKDAVSTMDEYMPRGKQILPRVTDVANSRNIQLSSQFFPEQVDKFTKALNHSIAQKTQDSPIKHAALSAWDRALPATAKFIQKGQDYLLSKAFLEPGSLWTSRWMGFMIGNMLGGSSSALGKVRNVLIGAAVAKPKTWGKYVLPIVARAEIGAPSGVGQAVGEVISPKAQRLLGNLTRLSSAYAGKELATGE